ncbi:periplasmic binding fold domain-containing protein (plasmid) [Rhizobium gallicum bv. gallicum R602sp]|uniref:Periplasmic binding fold domain-containing protein n=1 Tax=Rhizobium gallicum bv. gallicum R602sp TaxID=1041138 RepID=A0A0B4XIA8_9HYPH|nr:periplasmic binding fold domain-containing protein [Rhizobium gallicum bv. gallicum R602sp]
MREAMAMFSPTAIIASNDLLAFGAIGALRREGFSVPRDVSVAGFDGIAIGRLMDPPLTTIEMPDASMGATAASLLLDISKGILGFVTASSMRCVRKRSTCSFASAICDTASPVPT